MIRLNVPYPEKDEAKALGARWNPVGKFWYCEDDQVRRFARWYTGIIPEDANADGEKSNGDDEYMSVTAACMMIKNLYDAQDEFRIVKIRGEISGYNPRYGAHYFDIKDDVSRLHCTITRDVADASLEFELEDGMEVGLVGRLAYDGRWNQSQLLVAAVFDLGEGDAKAAFEMLKKKLQAEGLFDEKYKKPIPKYPKRIGLITSKDGAAVKDVMHVAKERNPYVQFVLYSVLVQGKDAPSDIVKGINFMDGQSFDLIVVTRGGGSRDDLVAFDDEKVVRAVFSAHTPIVSAVGHERDRTLIDYVSDRYCSTPTNAAEVVLPDVMTDIRRVKQLRESMKGFVGAIIKRKMLVLESRKTRLEALSPENVFKENRKKLTQETEKLAQNIEQIITRKKHRYELLVTTLNGLSPTAKLINGFGYVSSHKGPVTSVDKVKENDEIVIRIHDGEIYGKVSEVKKKELDQSGG